MVRSTWASISSTRRTFPGTATASTYSVACARNVKSRLGGDQDWAARELPHRPKLDARILTPPKARRATTLPPRSSAARSRPSCAKRAPIGCTRSADGVRGARLERRSASPGRSDEARERRGLGRPVLQVWDGRCCRGPARKLLQGRLRRGSPFLIPRSVACGDSFGKWRKMARPFTRAAPRMPEHQISWAWGWGCGQNGRNG